MNSKGSVTLGERLADLRASRGLSQRELAEAVSIGHSSIAKYENNEQTPPLQNLQVLCAYFQVSLDYLAGRADYNLDDFHLRDLYIIHEQKQISIGMLIELLRSLDHASRQEVYGLVTALIKGGKLKIKAKES